MSREGIGQQLRGEHKRSKLSQSDIADKLQCSRPSISNIEIGALHMLIWATNPDTIEYGKLDCKVANNVLTFYLYHLLMRLDNGLSFGILTMVLMKVEQQSSS